MAKCGGLVGLIEDLSECLPAGEGAIELAVKELLLASSNEAEGIRCLLESRGTNCLSDFTPGAVFLLRVFAEHLATPAEK
ncbi:hypothetical protein cyc_09003 [Cyclospora cayetanensis]|uniref:Uncharacterized protein n=1 Tax=Cyclospora cayetanensis TaxID=88456 RepID=A0A1D3D5P9_9EIME|nr:hypothetical protein cyc_09003 [Cyclospora cayetanensis]